MVRARVAPYWCVPVSAKKLHLDRLLYDLCSYLVWTGHLLGSQLVTYIYKFKHEVTVLLQGGEHFSVCRTVFNILYAYHLRH